MTDSYGSPKLTDCIRRNKCSPIILLTGIQNQHFIQLKPEKKKKSISKRAELSSI